MDAWEIGAIYLGKTIWPVVIIGGVLLFRKQIGTFIENLKKIQGAGITLETDPRDTAEREQETIDRVQEAVAQRFSNQVGGLEAARLAVKEAVDQNTISFDVSSIYHRRLGQIVYQVAFDADMSFARLLDRIWGTFEGRVSGYTYGIEWSLRDSESRESILHLFHEDRVGSSSSVRRRLRDTRTVAEVGIRAGMILVAEPISGAKIVSVGTPTIS